MSTTLKEAPNAVSEKPVKGKGAQAKIRPMAVVHIVLFCLVIFGFFLSTAQEAITNKSQMSLLEKRPYAAFPTLSFSLESIKSFPSGFQAFFNDRFSLRYELVGLLNELKWKVFRVSGSDKVLIGKNDWLFYIDGGNWETLKHELLPAEGLQQFVHTFETRRAWLAQHHIKYLLLFVPGKTEIYPEQIPSQYRQLNKTTM